MARRERRSYFPNVNSGSPAFGSSAYEQWSNQRFNNVYGQQEMRRAVGLLRGQGFTDREIRAARSGINEINEGPGARMGGLYPPGAGTYYNARRYADSGLSVGDRTIARANLTRAWNADLDYNRVANPQAYAQEQSQRSIARTGGSIFNPSTGEGIYGKNRPSQNLIQYQMPSGGTIGVPPGARPPTGFTGIVGGGGASQAEALRQTAAGGTPAFLNNPTTPYERSYAAGYNIPGVQQPNPTIGYQIGQAIGSGLRGVGTFAANLFNRQPQSQPLTPMYAGGGGYDSSGLTPGPTPYRRYLD